MQSKNRLARLRSFSPRSAAKPALYLGFMIAAASCAAELQDPDSYKVANETATATGGTTPAATGGITSTGGTTGAGGTTSTGGTAGPTGGAAPSMVTLDACVKNVFSTQCTACHSTALKDSFGGLDLSGDAVITRLKDVAATHKGVSNPTACVSGALLINSANPAESVLLKRVQGTQNCGTPMPFAPGLTGDNLKCIQDWVMKF
jgi:hypothetical protein